MVVNAPPAQPGDAATSSNKDAEEKAIPIRKRRRRTAAGGAQDDCFACRKRAIPCDRKRPYCSQCIEIGKDCSGYKTTLTWGVGVASRGKLRGMSLPVMNQANDTTLPGSETSPFPLSQRRQASTSARPQEDGRAGTKSGGRIRRSSRPSFTSQPILIKPALAPATTPAPPHGPSAPWAQSAPPTSDFFPGSVPVSRSLHRLQTTLSSHQEDCGQSDSASSSDSLFDCDFHTPIEHISYPAEDDLSPHVAGSLEMLMPDIQSVNSHASAGETQIPFSPSTQLLPFSDPQQNLEHNMFAFETPDDTEELYNGLDDGGAALNPISTSLVQPTFYNPFSKMTHRVQSLIQYYDANVCPFLVVLDGPQNPYRMHILQMALQSEGLQNALAALATNNMRMRRMFGSSNHPQDLNIQSQSIDSSPDIEETVYKQISVERLNQQLADPNAAQDESVLATLLILCLFHLCDSGFSKFRTQVAGVQKLLSMRPLHMRSKFTAWVEMFFVWLDVMTSSVNDRETEMTCERLNMFEYTADLGELEQFSGCDGRLFKLIARLGRLNMLAQGRSVQRGTSDPLQHYSAALPAGASSQDVKSSTILDGSDFDHLDGNGWCTSIYLAGNRYDQWSHPDVQALGAQAEFWTEWHGIRARLQDWHMDFSVPSALNLDPIRLSAEQGDMAHISECFRHAALLYTERLAHPLLPSASHQFQQHVIRALLHITALSLTSSVNKFLLWPLFIIGTECVNAGHQTAIRSRCIELQRESGFYNNLSVLEVLERVWADTDVGCDDASEMRARHRDSEHSGSGSRRQAFRWRLAMDRADGDYLVI